MTQVDKFLLVGCFLWLLQLILVRGQESFQIEQIKLSGGDQINVHIVCNSKKNDNGVHSSEFSKYQGCSKDFREDVLVTYSNKTLELNYAKSLQVEKFTVENIQDGSLVEFSSQSADLQIKHLVVKDNQVQGNLLSFSAATINISKVTIEDNSELKPGSQAEALVAVESGTKHCQFDEVIIKDNNFSGTIMSSNCSTSVNIDQVIIKNNTLRSGVHASASQAAVLRKVTIEGNTGGVPDGAVINVTESTTYSKPQSSSSERTISVNGVKAQGNTISGSIISILGQFDVELELFTCADNGHSDKDAFQSCLRVSNATSLTITDNEFQNNQGLSGSAIQVVRVADVLIENSKFQGNNATLDDAGAVSASDGKTITINECQFWQNEAAGLGGGLKVGLFDSVEISNTDFIDNQVHVGSGGAMWLEDVAQASVSYGSLKRNHANHFAGAIATYRCNAVRLHDLQLEQNSAKSQGGAANIFRSAEVEVRLLNVSDCFSYGPVVMVQNVADSNGVVLFQDLLMTDNEVQAVGSLHVDNAATAELGNVNFVNNKANNDSAGLVLSHIKDLSIQSSKFTGNSVEEGSGAAVQIRDCDQVSVSDCEFKYNKAGHATQQQQLKRSAMTRGGAAFISGSNDFVLLTDCLFSENYASTGGGMYLDSNCYPSVVNTKFEGNNATELGGGMAVSYSRAPVECNSLESQYVQQLGEMSSSSTHGLLVNTNFTKNSARRGGGVYLKLVASPESKPFVRLQESHFANNTAVMGGAVSVDDQVGILEFAYITFENNSASSFGGAFSTMRPIEASNALRFTQCKAQGNIAYKDGGFLYADAFTNLFFQSDVIIDNEAGGSGGAIYCQQCDTVVLDVYHSPHSDYAWNDTICFRFEQLYRSSMAQSKPLVTTLFRGNKANQRGGAFACHNCGVVMTGSVAFQDNQSQRGGAVALYGDVRMSIFVSDGSIFLKNSAQASSQGADGAAGALDVYNIAGGGLHAQPGILILYRSLFCGNKASYGGALFWSLQELSPNIGQSDLVTDSDYHNVLGCPSLAQSSSLSSVKVRDKASFFKFQRLYCNNSFNSILVGNGASIGQSSTDAMTSATGLTSTGGLFIYGVKFLNNVAKGGGGGGIFVDQWPDEQSGQQSPLIRLLSTNKPVSQLILYQQALYDIAKQADHTSNAASDKKAYQQLVQHIKANEGEQGQNYARQSAYGPQVGTAPSSIDVEGPAVRRFSARLQQDSDVSDTSATAVLRRRINGTYKCDKTPLSTLVDDDKPAIVMYPSESMNMAVVMEDQLGQPVQAGDALYSPQVFAQSVCEPDTQEKTKLSISGEEGSVVNGEGRAWFDKLKVEGLAGVYVTRFKFRGLQRDVPLMLDDCAPGQVNSTDRCDSCPINLFSYNPRNDSCDACPTDGALCLGNATVIPRDGYYMSSWNSYQIHACRYREPCEWSEEDAIARLLPKGIEEAGFASVKEAYNDLISQLNSTNPPLNSIQVTQGQPIQLSVRELVLYKCKMLTYGNELKKGNGEAFSITQNQEKNLNLPPPFDQATCFLSMDSDSLKSYRKSLTSLPVTYQDLQCSVGYEGHMCASCTRFKKLGVKFSAEEESQCSECKGQWFWVVGSSVATSVFILGATYVTMYSNRVGAQDQVGSSDILKSMIFFIQSMGIITQIDINMPKDVRFVSNLFNSIYSPVNAFPCILTTDDHWEAALGSTLIRLAMPLLVFLLLIPFWLCYARYLHKYVQSRKARPPVHQRFTKLVRMTSTLIPKRMNNSSRQSSRSNFTSLPTMTEERDDGRPAVPVGQPVATYPDESNDITAAQDSYTQGPSTKGQGATGYDDGIVGAYEEQDGKNDDLEKEYEEMERMQAMRAKGIAEGLERTGSWNADKGKQQVIANNEEQETSVPIQMAPVALYKSGMSPIGECVELEDQESYMRETYNQTASQRSSTPELPAPPNMNGTTQALSPRRGSGSDAAFCPMQGSEVGGECSTSQSDQSTSTHNTPSEIEEVAHPQNQTAQNQSADNPLYSQSSCYQPGVQGNGGVSRDASAISLGDGDSASSSSSCRSRTPGMQAQHRDSAYDFQQQHQQPSHQGWSQVAPGVTSFADVVHTVRPNLQRDDSAQRQRAPRQHSIGALSRSMSEKLRSRLNMEEWQDLLVLMINTMTFFYPPLMEVVMSVFVCNHVDDDDQRLPYYQHSTATKGYGYWWADMYTECFYGRHLILTLSVGVVGGLLICVGCPLALGFMLYRAHTHSDSSIKGLVLFLTNQYHDKYFYWECVRMGQLLGLSVLINATASTIDPQVRVQILKVLLLGFIVIHVICHPQRHKLLFQLELYTFTVNCVAVFFISLSLMPTMIGQTASNVVGYISIVGYFISTIPFLYLLGVRAKPRLAKLFRILRARWPSWRSCCCPGRRGKLTRSTKSIRDQRVDAQTSADLVDVLDTVFECCFL